MVILQSNFSSCISYATLSVCLGMKPALQNGTDVLLDLLSIGDPPAQSSSSTSDILSSVQDNKLPVAPLDGLLSPSAPATPVIDLLDGFAVKPPSPGKNFGSIWKSFQLRELFHYSDNLFFPLYKTENNGSAFPSIVAFESSLLKVLFNFSKPSGNPQTTLIQATFTNLSSDSFTDFIFQAAVPKVISGILFFLFFVFFIFEATAIPLHGS